MKQLKFLFITLIFLSSFFIYSNALANLSISPLKFEFDIEKNSSKKEKIKITNNSEKAITIYSSEEDFTAGDDSGTPKFIKAEEQENPEMTLANWIKVESENVTLAPGESKEVNFTIKVPKDAEPGGHYAAVFFSPGLPNGSQQVAVVQRMGVLVLVNVPGDVKITGDVKNFSIGNYDVNKKLVENDSFIDFPIVFQTLFQNGGNVHLKPTGKITLIDQDGEVLKNIGKELITSPAGAYLGEKMVDYIPINDGAGNVLPKSERKFETIWEGFGYSVLNEDGTKSVKFKNLSEYYADKASEKSQYLMFWQSINTRKVSKKITAKFELSYEGKDKERKDFLDSKDFKVTYEEKYVGLNYYMIGGVIILIILIATYFIVIAPRQRKRKEEELKRKIMEEMQNQK